MNTFWHAAVATDLLHAITRYISQVYPSKEQITVLKINLLWSHQLSCTLCPEVLLVYFVCVHTLLHIYSLFCVCFVENSIWGDVSNMNDAIKVEYSKLEELFSQNGSLQIEDKPEEKVQRRISGCVEVSQLIVEHVDDDDDDIKFEVERGSCWLPWRPLSWWCLL